MGFFFHDELSLSNLSSERYFKLYNSYYAIKKYNILIV